MTPTMRKLPALLSPSSSSCFTCWSWTLWYAIVSLLYVALNLDSSGVVMIVCAMDTDDDGFFQEAATYEQEGSKFDHDSSSSCGSSQSHRCRVSPPHWLQENYPSPKENFKVCRCGENSKRLCDPDSILEDSEIAALEEEVLRPTFYLKDKFCSNNSNPFTKEKNTDQTAMKESESKPTQQQHDDAEVDVKSSSSSKDLSTLSNAIDEEKHEVFELQMAVALVKKMDLRPFSGTESRKERAAESFARYLHDSWGGGVVVPTACGSGGIGVLVFLSVLDRVVHISRGIGLEGILTDKRLDEIIESIKPTLQESDGGFYFAIQQAGEMVQNFVERGPPTAREEFLDWFIPNAVVLVILSVVFRWIARDACREREQNRIYARVSSQLSELDRAHAEALQGQYRTTSCPICLEGFKMPPEDGFDPVLGSDRKPPKLLRCGHVFDESCWAEWVSSGEGDITKCPICNQDVGIGGKDRREGNLSQDVTSLTEQAAGRMQQQPENEVSKEEEESYEFLHQAQNYQQQQALERYYYERNFRLARLELQFPQYFQHQQTRRWSQPSYSDSMVRDPVFMNRDPSVVRASRRASGTFVAGSASFGGNFSGGGRYRR